MSNVIGIRGSKEAPRDRRSSMETILVTQQMVDRWEVPTFQRPKRINEKVRRLAEEMKADGVSIPGVLTLGQVGNRGPLYLVDGQHRVEAFRLSGLEEAIADVRIVHFDNLDEMGPAFVELNGSLVPLKVDDILRGHQSTSRALQRLTKECPFVTYGQVRRGPASPVLSMSQTVRSWFGSAAETPAGNITGRPAITLVHDMDADPETVDTLIRFLQLARVAWGLDPQHYRLWGSLNLSMCMWLFRRLVLDRTRGVKRYVVLTDTQFRQCLMALSADGPYVDFLVGRHLGERDRSPTYSHLRRIFTARLKTEGNPKPLMPQPAWAK
jgi:hypothetical protein